MLALPSFDFARYESLLAQLRGTPVVVNIWSSWCGPCRQETDELVDAFAAHGSRVQFLGVDILDQRDDAIGFLREHGVPYPSLFDADGAIRDSLGFVGEPDTLFYATDGDIASTWTGPLTPAALRANLAKIAP